MRAIQTKLLPLPIALIVGLCATGYAHASTLYVSNFGNNTISAIDSAGNVTTFVTAGAGLNDPIGLAIDPLGDLLVANFLNKNSANGIDAVSSSGTVTPYAYLNDYPAGIALDSSGNIYVANVLGDTVSEVSGPFPSSGASNINLAASGLPLLNLPQALAFDSNGNLYVVSANYNGIAEISGGNLSSFVTSDLFNAPDGIAIDTSGNIYVANGGGTTISKVTPEGDVSTYATGLENPTGLAFDSAGDLLVADSGSNTIQEVAPGGGVASLFASGLDEPQYLVFAQDQSASTPEPAAVGLFCAGGLALLLRSRRP